jgi:membrane protein
VLLLVTALALILTIDRTLNNIWRVRGPARFAQRVLIYWAAITLGPLLLAVSLSSTSYVISASRGLVGRGARHAAVFDIVEFVLLAAAAGRAVPLRAQHARVRRTPCHRRWHVRGPRHRPRQARARLVPRQGANLLGGLRRLRYRAHPAGVDLRRLGDRAAGRGGHGLPAQPAVRRAPPRRHAMAGSSSSRWRCCSSCTRRTRHGVQGAWARPIELAARWRSSELQLEPVLQTLVQLDWIGPLAEEPDNEDPRYVLLADPRSTRLEPLLKELLMPQAPALDNLWHKGPLRTLVLQDVLPY